MADFTDQFTYGVRKIQATLEAKKPIVSFLRNRYFSGLLESENENVSVEVRRRGTVLLPSIRRTDSAINVGAVAPHTISTYTPPYFFYEATGTIGEANKRVFGEPVEAPYSKAERMVAIMAEKIDLGIRESLIMNEEAQCSQIIKTGKVTPKAMAHDGTLYAAAEINFGVDSDLVGGPVASLWTTSSDILKALRDYCLLVFGKTGKLPTEMIVGKKVLETLLGNAKFIAALDNRRIEGNQMRSQAFAGYPGVAYNGTINVPMVGDLSILSYVNGYAYNGDASETEMIDYNGLLLTSPGWGTMGYAGLYDKVSGMPGMVAGKTLLHAIEGDVRNHFAYSAYVQSAPLAMPTQLDAWFYKTVVAAD